MGPVCGSLFAEMQTFDGMMACVIYVIRHSARNARVGIALLAHNLPTLDALKCGKSPARGPIYDFGRATGRPGGKLCGGLTRHETLKFQEYFCRA